MSDHHLFYVGVDPSINHTGFAVVHAEDKRYRLLHSGTIKQSPEAKDARYARIAVRLAMEVGGVLGGKDREKTLFIVERPTYEDSEAGLCLARTKNLPKLFGAATVAIAALALLGFQEYAFVSASQWKRNVPKPEILGYMERLFPARAGQWVSEDEWEAVAIAAWAHFQRNENRYEIWRV